MSPINSILWRACEKKGEPDSVHPELLKLWSQGHSIPLRLRHLTAPVEDHSLAEEFPEGFSLPEQALVS